MPTEYLARHCLVAAMIVIVGWPVAAGGAENPPQPTTAPAASPAAPSTPTPPSAPARAPSAGGPLAGLPALQPGLWEYRRTQVASGGGTPKTTTFRKCSSPNDEFERKLSELRERGCVFTPFRQHANRYEASWHCDLGDGRVLAMHDVVTIIGPTSYQDENQAVIAHDTTESSTVAVRLGECPADSSATDGGPAPSTPKPR